MPYISNGCGEDFDADDSDVAAGDDKYTELKRRSQQDSHYLPTS